jgi:bifunctional DNase/RNase
MEKIQVDILGLSTSPASGGAYALILKEVSGTRRLPIIIGAFEAQSIALEMEGIKPPRPLTHDLMKTIIDRLGVTLSEVTVSELRDGTFYAKLSLDSQEIDSRPSDAIALAVRYGVPIFVSDKVMDEASFVPEAEGEEGENPIPAAKEKKPAPQRMSKLEALNAQLKEAIEKEDYEKAARIRDEIRKLSPGN